MKSYNSVPELIEKYSEFPSTQKMSKEQAREMIEAYALSGNPVHPDLARALYNTAELPLPDHLIPQFVTLQPDEIERIEEESEGTNLMVGKYTPEPKIKLRCPLCGKSDETLVSFQNSHLKHEHGLTDEEINEIEFEVAE